jgi:hypothetical protein
MAAQWRDQQRLAQEAGEWKRAAWAAGFVREFESFLPEGREPPPVAEQLPAAPGFCQRAVTDVPGSCAPPRVLVTTPASTPGGSAAGMHPAVRIVPIRGTARS